MSQRIPHHPFALLVFHIEEESGCLGQYEVTGFRAKVCVVNYDALSEEKLIRCNLRLSSSGEPSRLTGITGTTTVAR
jgi:hypothetical protein